jgi:hypothetical protein
MSDINFTDLCDKAFEGKTEEVLSAVNLDPTLATRADFQGSTLMIYSCVANDNHLLVQGLVEKGANVNARDIHSWNALMMASRQGYIAVCSVLLSAGADFDSNNQYFSALSLAALFDHLQVCLLLIKCRANLMLVLSDGKTALDVYGTGNPGLSSAEIEQRRSILWTAFEHGPHPDMCWKRRWPMMNVMTGCGFRPLKAKLLELILQSDALFKRGELPPPIVLDSPEKRRAYYMGLIFACDGLLRLIVSFL